MCAHFALDFIAAVIHLGGTAFHLIWSTKKGKMESFRFSSDEIDLATNGMEWLGPYFRFAFVFCRNFVFCLIQIVGRPTNINSRDKLEKRKLLNEDIKIDENSIRTEEKRSKIVFSLLFCPFVNEISNRQFNNSFVRISIWFLSRRKKKYNNKSERDELEENKIDKLSCMHKWMRAKVFFAETENR